MKKTLTILSILLTISSFSQVKTFSAVNIVDSFAVGGSEFIDTVYNFEDYNGNMQLDTIVANHLHLPNDTIEGSTAKIAISDLDTLLANPPAWKINGNYLYPNGNYNVGIGTTTPSSLFEVKDYITFDDYNYSTAIGYGTKTNGGYNTFYGYQSGYNNTNGSSNVFIGSYSGWNNTLGYTNVFIGSSAGYKNQSGAKNVLIGQNAGRNINSHNNTIIGESAGFSNQYGDDNTFIGYYSAYGNYGSRNIFIGSHSGHASNTTFGSDNIFIGYYAGAQETGSNKLYIENSNSNTPLIYGDFANDYLHFYADSIDYINAVAQYHRLDSFTVSSADTWVDIKLDTNIANEGTYGFKFNSDSTGIICTTQGIIRVQGCVHWIWSGATTTRVKLYTRVLIDGVEARCLQANSFKDRNADDYGTQPFTGTIYATYGSEIKLQVRVSNTNMYLKGDDVYDNPVAASINFEKITYK